MTWGRRVRVLVVDDEEDLRVAVVLSLRAAKFEVTEVGDLAGAHAALAGTAFGCAVFDRKLPDGDAVDYVHQRRVDGLRMPVLFLTGLSGVADRVAGFASGGDDYLGKPFDPDELVARVRRLSARDAYRPSVLRYADVEMDCARREVRRAGVLLGLPRREFAVLEFLLTRPEHVITRSELIEHCWDESHDPMSNVVDVVVTKIRSRLGRPNLVQAVRGRGYRLATEVAG